MSYNRYVQRLIAWLVAVEILIHFVLLPCLPTTSHNIGCPVEFPTEPSAPYANEKLSSFLATDTPQRRDEEQPPTVDPPPVPANDTREPLINIVPLLPSAGINLAVEVPEPERDVARFVTLSTPLTSLRRGLTYPAAWPPGDVPSPDTGASTTTISDLLIPLPGNTKRLCVDVGTLNHQTAPMDWLGRDETFVVIVEQNPHRAAVVHTLENPIFLSQTEGYWPGRACTPKMLRETARQLPWHNVSGRLLVVPMAVDSDHGVKRVRVDGDAIVYSAAAPLGALLAFLPASHSSEEGTKSTILWDTLRVQGGLVAPHEVLRSAGPLLTRFVCVVIHGLQHRLDSQTMKVLEVANFAQATTAGVFVNQRYAALLKNPQGTAPFCRG